MALTQLGIVLRAADFAARKHRNQRRKSGDHPYINHPLSVARRLADTGGIDDPVTLAAALLHDTIEDTDTTREEVEAEFGSEIAAVVAEVTDDKSLLKAARKREQIRHASEISERARMVKLADKLDNLTDLTRAAPKGWDLARVQGYFAWAHAVVDVLRGVNEPLERALDDLFARELKHGDGDSSAEFRAVPADPEQRATLLQRYLEAMDRVDD